MSPPSFPCTDEMGDVLDLQGLVLLAAPIDPELNLFRAALCTKAVALILRVKALVEDSRKRAHSTGLSVRVT